MISIVVGDIFFVVLVTLLFIPLAVLTEGPARIVVGVLMLLVFPGYTLTLALFPRRESLSKAERLGLTFVLSIASVALLGLALSRTPWGIRLSPTLVSASVMVAFLSLIALMRRSRLPKSERFSLSYRLGPIRWSGLAAVDRALYLSLLVVVLAAFTTLVYVIARPKPTEDFTNFYVLGPSGMMQGYPQVLKQGETAEVAIVVENHENQRTEYGLAAVVGGATQSLGTIILDNGERWRLPFTLTAFTAGPNQVVEFLLYRGAVDEPYLTLRLWLDVQG